MSRTAAWFWAATIMLGCAYAGLAQQMWAARHEFEIKARSPTLIFLSTLGGLVVMMMVLLQWRRRAQGSSLPCTTMAYITPFASVFMALPYLFRVVRLIVAHNPEYRNKFARFIKWKPLAIMWILCAITVAMETALVQHFIPRSYCFTTDPFLMGIIIVFGGGPALYLARSLRNVYDPLGNRQELELVLWTAIICGVTNTLLQVLVALKMLPESPAVHICDEIVTFVFGAQVGVWSMLLPLASHKKWYRRTKLFVLCSEASSPFSSPTPAVGGVLDLAARSGDIGVRFREFCHRHLVLENWEFILNVMAFKKMSPGSDEQHRAFIEIVDQFIASTSPGEINIESAMRKRIMAFRPREAFSRLDSQERSKLLDEPLSEIVRLLEFNLLENFWKTELQRQDEELADIAKEDRNLMDIMVSGEESGRGGRRGSSVNASRQRSSRSQSSRANSLSPGPTSREEGSGKRRAEREASPSAGGSKQLSRGRSNSTRSLSSNSLSLQPLEEKRACPNESTNSSSTSTPGSRERPFFPYTRRSSQIRPLLSSIEASGRAASEEQRGARVALDDVTSAKDTLVDPQ